MIDFKNIKKYQNVILYFMMAIVIPCIILGLLAFRGIRNDQALIEKKQRMEAEEKASEVNEYILSIINKISDDFDLMKNNVQSPIEPFFHDTILESFIDRHPFVATICHFEQNDIHMLHSSFLFLPEDLEMANDPGHDETSYEDDLAWKYEFQVKDYEKAIQIYRKVLRNNSTHEQAAFALNSIARLYQKDKKTAKAHIIYDEIIANYPQIKINGKMSLGLLAILEKINLFHLEYRKEEAHDWLEKFYSELLRENWSISEASYRFFKDRIDQLDQMLHHDSYMQMPKSKMDSLRTSENFLIEQSKQLIHFRSEMLNALNEKPGAQQAEEIYSLLSRLGSSNYSYQLVADNNKGYWGILIDKKALLQNKIIPILNKYNRGEKYWIWNMQNGRGVYLLPLKSSKIDGDPIAFNLNSEWSDYRLLAFAQSKSLFSTFLPEEQGLYLFLFLIIAGILITGIFSVVYFMNRELQLTQMKSDFMATVSHEFKSPLTAIRQMAEMFQNDRVPQEKKREYYNILLQEGERLTHLVDNILDMTRIEQGKKRYNFRLTGLEQTLKKTIEHYQKRYSEKGLKFNLRIKKNLPDVLIDEESIQQVLHNLLDNSIKYSGTSNKIDLSASQQNGVITVSVKDYGIGILKKEQSKIFERFYRIRSDQTSGIKGSGVGLALVKRIIEAHGGKILVKSQPSKGSTFTIHLPISKQNHS